MVKRYDAAGRELEGTEPDMYWYWITRSDHEREVAAINADARKRYDEVAADALALRADRDALQREVAELRAQAQHLGPFIRRYQRDGIWLVEHQVNLGGEQGTVTYAYLSDYDALQKRCGEAEAQREVYVSTLIELRTRFHVAGKRPETCHEMSLIDDALTMRAALRPAEGET